MSVATAGLTGARDGSSLRWRTPPVLRDGQLSIAQGTDPIGGTRLQQVVRLGWGNEGEADC